MRRFRHLHLATVGFMMLYPGLSGQAAEGFKMLVQPLHIPERGEVTSYVILTLSNRFSFLPPPNWNVSENAAAKSVVCVPEDYGAKISFKITPEIGRTIKDFQTDSFRDEIRGRYADVRLVNEFLSYTSGRPGVAFDLERTFEKRPPVTTRLVFVPFGEGLVEFELTTESRKFDRYHHAMGNLLTSFRIDPASRAK